MTQKGCGLLAADACLQRLAPGRRGSTTQVPSYDWKEQDRSPMGTGADRIEGKVWGWWRAASGLRGTGPGREPTRLRRAICGINCTPKAGQPG